MLLLLSYFPYPPEERNKTSVIFIEIVGNNVGFKSDKIHIALRIE
jgi:hypothetical protein